MLLLHRKLFQKTKGGGRYGTSLPGSFSPWFLKKNKTHLILLTDQIWVFVCFYFSGIWYLANVYCNNWANLKKLFVSYHPHHKKKVTRATGKTFFFTWFKLNITFSFKCYLHHNCNINLNWNNTQLYSSAKPLYNVSSSVFWFVNFCFLPFLCRTSVQKWKKIWFCYVHKLIGKKEMFTKISKCLFQNLFIGAAAQTRAVYKNHEILITLKRCITLSFTFLDKVSIVLWLLCLRKHFSFIWRQCK